MKTTNQHTRSLRKFLIRLGALTLGPLTSTNMSRSQFLQPSLDLIEPGFRCRLLQPGEFSVQENVIVVAGKHELVLPGFNHGNATRTSENFKPGEFEQQFQGNWKHTETVAQFFAQSAHPRSIGEPCYLAIDLDSLVRI